MVPQVGDRVFAHGKDMYYDGWEDTVQINYGHPKAREEMTKVASRACARVCAGADDLRACAQGGRRR